MDDLKERLIEAAVRPLEDDAELKLAAIQQLSGLMLAGFSGAEEAIARWDAVDERSRRPWWKMVLFGLLACLLAVIWVPTAWDILRLSRLLKSMGTVESIDPGIFLEKRFGMRLDARQKLLLFGDHTKVTQVEKIKALWDSQAANPVYFSEYVRVHLKETKQLPPDFLMMARLIDPENAWFTYLAAAVEADGGYEKIITKKTQKEATSVPWKITDQTKLEKSAALLHEARNQPRCQDYLAEITRERIQALHVNTQMDNIFARHYFSEQSLADIVAIRNLSNAMSAYGWVLGEAGDQSTFKNLLADTDALVWTTSHMKVSDLMEASAFRAIAATKAEKLGPISRELGLPDDAVRLENIHQRIEAEKLARKNRQHLIEGREYGANGGFLASVLLHNLACSVKSPPLFADRYLLPGRLADHAMVSWISCFCTAPLLGLSLMFMGMAKAKGPAILKFTLAKRIGELIRPVDWCWIVGLGVVCPAVYLVILEPYRPVVGLNADNFVSNLLILPLFYLTALFATFTSIPTIVARWRLAKRVEIFGFTRCPSRVVTLIVLWNLAQFLLLGLIPSRITTGVAFYGVGFTFAICAFAATNASLTDYRKRSLESSTLNKLLNPTFGLAAILLLCLIPVFKSAQQQAFEQDQLTRLDPAFPAASPYENRVAVQMQNETRKILGEEH